MSRWRPCKRRDFVRALLALGFEGPFSGTRHQFMTYAGQRLSIPPNSEYSIPQLKFMLREVEGLIGRQISADQWQRLRTGQQDDPVHG